MDTASLLASAPATATAVAIIDLGAVAANFCDLRTRHRAPVAGVVKADAYGLSAAHVAPVLVREGAEMLFTAGFDEAAALPDCGPRAVLDGLTPGSEVPYPGTCRQGLPPGRTARSWRVRVEGELERAVGDFVVLRADGFYAYQLAVVVDDEEQGVTDVVRGADLLSSTPRQVHLQRLLGYRTPRYRHVPVVRGPSGDKLSKQTGAASVELEDPACVLRAALEFLGRPAPAAETDLLRWAIEKGPLKP